MRGNTLPPPLKDIEKAMTFSYEDRAANHNPYDAFLKRFDIFDNIDWNTKAIGYCVDSVVRNQAIEQIDYSEISISVEKYARTMGINSRADLAIVVGKLFKAACLIYRTTVNPILAINMSYSRDVQKLNAAVIESPEVADLYGGVDLVNDERHFDATFYADVLKPWRSAKKAILIHAGETGSAKNVIDAIDKVGASRIRHGLAAAAHPDILAAARDHGVCFDVSLHSNFLVGTVANMQAHPIKDMLAAGCNVTLGTDDPAVFRCTLEDEYRLARDFALLGGDEGEIAATERQLKLNSIRFAATDNLVR